MQIYTVDQPQDAQVEVYLGPVSAPVVLGINALRDWLTHWRDLVGGRARSLERSLEQAQELAGRKLVEAAATRGANAVVGLRMDSDVVTSRRGGVMVMVTAVGTAVRLAHSVGGPIGPSPGDRDAG